MDKKQREAQKRQEDQALSRGLLWVVGAIVLEFFLVLVNKYYINYRMTEASIAAALVFDGILKAIRWGALLGVVVGAAWAVWMLWSKGRCGARPVVVTAVCGALLICAHITLVFKDSGMRMLFLLVPAWAALALVYYIYQREFFLSAITSGTAALGLWMVRASGGGALYAAVAATGILAVALVAFRLKQGGGALSVGGKKLEILPAGANYLLIFLSCLAGLAALVIALAAGAAAAYYLVYVMVAWLFVLLVYYTVKMM